MGARQAILKVFFRPPGIGNSGRPDRIVGQEVGRSCRNLASSPYGNDDTLLRADGAPSRSMYHTPDLPRGVIMPRGWEPQCIRAAESKLAFAEVEGGSAKGLLSA